MGSNVQTDCTVYKVQLTKVLDPSGNFLGTWLDAPLLSGFKESINSAPSPLTVKLPRQYGNDNTDNTIAAENVVQYWLFGPGLPGTGLLRFQGVIDKIEPSISNANEESVKLTIVPYGAALGNNGITGTVQYGTPGNAGTYVDPFAIMKAQMPSPLTLDNASSYGSGVGSSGIRVQYTFQNQTYKSIWDTCLLMLPANWFYRVNMDKSVTINQTPVTAQNTVYVGQHITEVNYSNDYTNLRNKIYVTGSGTINATATGTDLATYGTRLYYYNDSRVVDTTTAQTIANGYLTFYDRGINRTVLRLMDYRGNSSGIGYDIESLAVGQSIQIVDASKPPGSVSAVMPIVSLAYYYDFCELECGTLQPSQDLALFRVAERFQDFSMIV